MNTSKMEEFLPPTPDKVVKDVAGLVQDIADKAQEISRYDPVAVGAGIVSKAAGKIKGGY